MKDRKDIKLHDSMINEERTAVQFCRRIRGIYEDALENPEEYAGQPTVNIPEPLWEVVKEIIDSPEIKSSAYFRPQRRPHE